METNETTLINREVRSAVDIDFSYLNNSVIWINRTAMYMTNLNTSVTRSKCF